MANASGYKREYDQTFLTPRVLYRQVDENDESGAPDVDDVDVPEIRLDIDTDSRTANCSKSGKSVTYQRAGRAYNGQLFLYAHLGDSVTKATINVWVYDSFTIATDITEAYLLVDTIDISGSAFVPLRNIPAGKYKVTVTAISGSGTITITEQHTA